VAAVVALAVVALSLTVPTALGDAQVTAVFRDQYGSSTYTIDQGQSVTFANSDVDSHNVTATATGPDGSPLFQSATIGASQSAAVSGTQYLTSGSYAFYCTVHPFMKATLTVTSAGAPAPRPGGSPPSSPSSSPPPSGPGPVVVTPRSGKQHAKRHKHRRKRHRHRKSLRRH
jgi:plastocyanin